MANWELIGELTVTNQLQFFPNNVIADTFRITTTITNIDDWNKWKFRSSAYLRFHYVDGSASPNYYVKVFDVPTIYVFAVPEELRQQSFIVRVPSVIRASRYLPLTPDINFAAWAFKLEALL